MMASMNRRHLFFKPILLLLSLFFLTTSPTFADESCSKTVLLAILARNKAHVLPDYLTCLEQLDYDKKAITVYINSNNNDDETETLLRAWVERVKDQYGKIVADFHEVEGLEKTNPHVWTTQRFKLLGSIRNKSMSMALQENCDFYFVADCDNFLTPCTLKELVAKDKPIIAPMLLPVPEKRDPYSNYFCAIDAKGYYKHDSAYLKILNRQYLGVFEVPVVHCAYLIKQEYLPDLSYIDSTDDFEFVIFSREARKKGIPQYICNEKYFGTLLHFLTGVTLEQERERVQAFGSLVPKP